MVYAVTYLTSEWFLTRTIIAGAVLDSDKDEQSIAFRPLLHDRPSSGLETAGSGIGHWLAADSLSGT